MALGVIIDPQTMLLSVHVFQKTAWEMPTGKAKKSIIISSIFQVLEAWENEDWLLSVLGS